MQALPAFYPTVQKALALLEDPLSDNTRLQQVLSSDQAVAARVLRLANSAYFSYRSQVRTISLAAAIIGGDQLRTVLRRFLAEELVYLLSGHKPAAAPVRNHSLAAAAAARLLAERLLRKDAEQFLLAGLLHNIGDLVLLSEFRESYQEMLETAAGLPRPQAEVQIFGVESRHVGRWLLEAWKFPVFFCEVVEYCGDPWALTAPVATPLADLLLLHAARLLAVEFCARRSAAAATEVLPTRLLAALELTTGFLADLRSQLPAEVERLRNPAR